MDKIGSVSQYPNKVRKRIHCLDPVNSGQI